MAKRRKKALTTPPGVPSVLSVRLPPSVMADLRGLVLARCYEGENTSMRAETEEALRSHIKRQKARGIKVRPRAPGDVRCGPPLGNTNRRTGKKKG